MKAALAGAEELPPHPVVVQTSLVFGPQRSWPNLWKMAIDALDPLLGRSFPDDGHDPQDGRIVRLGLHAKEDPSLGWGVAFAIRARSADLGWPELAWFARMSEGERVEWLLDDALGSAPTRPSRRGVIGPQAPRPRRPPASPPAEGVLAIDSLEAFMAAIRNGELLVLIDSAGPPRLHRAAARCPGVTEENFLGKVIERGGRNGRYFAVSSEATARVRWPRLGLCGRCG